MFFDGSLNINGVGARILFISSIKDKLCYILWILLPASNNIAEYEACLHGIQLAVELGIKRLYVYGDYAQVINQLNKEWDMTHEKMDLYCKEIRRSEANFYGIEYIHVVRDENQAADVVWRCEGCQFFAKRTHVPTHEIQTIPSSWPFACWGLDMIGPFKPAPGNFKFVFVLIDKFSKWIEYMPLVKETSEKAVEFLNQIIHRFGVPNNIITDLGT